MFKINSVEYPTCPHCGTLLNDLSLIPLSTVWFGHAARVVCPGAFGKERCGKTIAVAPTISVSFKAYKIEKEEKCETPSTN